MTSTGPVLVTGATGFLGGAIARALLEAGLALRLLHRPNRRDALGDLLAAGRTGSLEAAEGDVTDADSLRAAMAGCGAVVHAAGLVSRSGTPEQFEDVNVRGLARVLAAARATGVERVVYTSSFLALGPSDVGPGRPGPAAGNDEEDLTDDAPALDLYQASKHRAALLARREAGEGAPIVTLLPGVIVGPGPLTEANLVTSMVSDHLAGRVVPLPEGGRRTWSFVHVDDVAAGHLAALRRGRPGEAYVLGGENATLRRLFREVAALTGRRPPRLGAPHPLPWLIGLGEELLERATGRPPRQLTRGVARVLRRDWALCSDKAARELGWAPRPLVQVLRETIAWLVAEGHAPRRAFGDDGEQASVRGSGR